MRILDLFCGAGGSAEGFHRAGWEVVGVDVKYQPNFPFEFVQADALQYLREVGAASFDAIHASPPCQKWTTAQKIQGNDHVDLIAPTRVLLQDSGLPYVIENVVGAPLNGVVLDGTMFAHLRTKRPRIFETNWPLIEPPPIRDEIAHTKMGRVPVDDRWMHIVGNFSDAEAGRRAMGIHWMSRKELREAIPPAYTEYIGWELRSVLWHGGMWTPAWARAIT